MEEANGPTELSVRMLKRLDKYENETRKLMESYDKLEQENDELKIRCQ